MTQTKSQITCRDQWEQIKTVLYKYKVFDYTNLQAAINRAKKCIKDPNFRRIKIIVCQKPLLKFRNFHFDINDYDFDSKQITFKTDPIETIYDVIKGKVVEGIPKLTPFDMERYFKLRPITYYTEIFDCIKVVGFFKKGGLSEKSLKTYQDSVRYYRDLTYGKGK